MNWNRVILGCLAYCLVFATTAVASADKAEVVTVAPGTYDFAEILTKSGTPKRWLRYQPEKPGTVIIRGGRIEKVQYIILDGFTINGRLYRDFPKRAHGCDIRISNVTLQNCEVIGPKDVHTGYDMTGKLNSKEFTGGTPSTGLTARAGCRNITFDNITVHGFNNAGSFSEGTTITIKNSLIRNNFNGFSFRGDVFVMEGNVMWVHPNHQFSIHAPQGVLRFHNNLFVDAQDMIKAGANWEGCKEVYLIHNTFWIAPNRPYPYSGLQLNRVSKKVVIRDNLIVNKRKGWLAVAKPVLKMLDINHNLYYHHERGAGEDFFSYRDGETVKEIDIKKWQALTGQDRRSLFAKAPLFKNAPQYRLPLPLLGNEKNDWGFWTPPTPAAARARFVLKSDSPGTGAASDGKDIGILP